MKTIRISELRQVLGELDFKPEKTLGQNFLIDGNIRQKILDAAEVNQKDIVLEIGTGIGALTDGLAERAGKVITVEKDRRLWEWLKTRYNSRKNVELLCADILSADLTKLLSRGVNKVVSALPYSTASAILVNFFKLEHNPPLIVTTLQLEVARRLVARPGIRDFSLLSVWSQLKYKGQIHHIINPTCFYPPPGVKSALVRLEHVGPGGLVAGSQSFFFDITKACFSHRRKQLKNVFKFLVETWSISEKDISEALQAAEINSRLRAEDIPIGKWITFSNTLYRQSSSA